MMYTILFTEYESQFDIFNDVALSGIGYNYNSIMHYDSYAFTRNGRPTIDPKYPNVKLIHASQRKHLHYYDALKIIITYGCQG